MTAVHSITVTASLEGLRLRNDANRQISLRAAVSEAFYFSVSDLFTSQFYSFSLSL